MHTADEMVPSSSNDLPCPTAPIEAMTEVTSGTAAAAAIGGSAETVVAVSYVQAMPQQGGERDEGLSPVKDERWRACCSVSTAVSLSHSRLSPVCFR